MLNSKDILRNENLQNSKFTKMVKREKRTYWISITIFAISIILISIFMFLFINKNEKLYLIAIVFFFLSSGLSLWTFLVLQVDYNKFTNKKDGDIFNLQEMHSISNVEYDKFYKAFKVITEDDDYIISMYYKKANYINLHDKKFRRATIYIPFLNQEML